MSFLPVRLSRPKHVEIDVSDRRDLHTVLQGVHRAVHRGRGDIAAVLVKLAAAICRLPSDNDNGQFCQTTHVTKGTR